jgi:hypothetical protein
LACADACNGSVCVLLWPRMTEPKQARAALGARVRQPGSVGTYIASYLRRSDLAVFLPPFVRKRPGASVVFKLHEMLAVTPVERRRKATSNH